MQKKNTVSKGFTLVELLVVIAIVAILAVVVLVAINPLDQLKKSRNARRLDNLAQVNSAIGQALTEATGGAAPFSANESGTSCTNPTTWVTFAVGSGASLANKLPVLPRDPLNDATNGYCYTFKADANGQLYKLAAKLELVGDAATTMTNDGGTDINLYETGTNVSIP